MPCSDHRDHEDRREIQKRLDAATQAACDMSKVFHVYPQLLFDITSETIRWILDHDELDTKRKDAESWDQ